MQPTERTLTPTPAPAPRPAVRAFSRRDLLLTTWDQRFAMSPGDQVKFAYEKWLLRMSLQNEGRSFVAEAVAEFQAVQTEKKAPLMAVAPAPV